MKIVTVGNTKGGVGKSTITCNLAVCAAQKGKSVLMVDTDEQASSLAFRAMRKNADKNDIKSIQITTPTLAEDLTSFSTFDLIFVDAGGRDNAVFRSAIIACDLLVVPVLPSVYDLWAAGDTIEIIREARVYNKNFKSRMLLNQLMPKTIIAREAINTLEDFKNDVPLMEARIHARTVFKLSIMDGEGVLESNPRCKAVEEITGVYNEILGLIA